MQINKTRFEKLCYEKYKLHWMLSHGFTLQDVITRLQENYKENKKIEPEYDVNQAFADLEKDTGLGQGTLWVCFEEFLMYEYKDDGFMKVLLTKYPSPFLNAKEAIKNYEKHTNERKKSHVNKIRTQTA